MLSAERMERLRQALLTERSRLRKDLDNLQPNQSSLDTNSGVGNHPAEDASLTYEQETQLSLRRNDEATLHEVDRALQRMERGTYGVCERCSREIDFARLKAKPHARLCMDCQRLAEL